LWRKGDESGMVEGVWVLKWNGRRYKCVHNEDAQRWHSIYDGFSIYETKNCRTCPDFVKARTEPLDDKVVGVCLRGVAWKVLLKHPKPRKCSKKRLSRK
jgi:hypothetical protein